MTPPALVQVEDEDDIPCLRCSQEGKIKDLHEVIVGTTTQEGMASILRRYAEDVGKLRHTVYGNGHVGLVETVRWMKWVMCAVSAGVGGLVLKAAYELLKHHFVK